MLAETPNGPEAIHNQLQDESLQEPTHYNGDSLAARSTAAFELMALESKSFLTIHEVARLLRCAVSTLQNIPTDDLPTYDGVGRYTLYLKSDIETYIRSRRRTIKRGSGLNKPLNVIDHIPDVTVDNPALEALKQL